MNDAYKWFSKCNVIMNDSIPKGSAYILPDGSFAHLNDSGYRTHAALDAELRDVGYPVAEDAMIYLIPIEYMSCVRVNDGTNFLSEVVVDLPKDKITSSQLDSIENYIDNLQKDEITVGCTLTGVSMYYNLNETSASKIRDKIKNYYITGKLHEECEVD